MKSRNLLALTVALAMVMLLFTGCGAEKADIYNGGDLYRAEADGIYDSAADMEYAEKPSEAGKGDGEPVTEQKLIKTVSMSAETEDLTKLLDDLSAQIAEAGGYVESRNVYNGSSYSGSRSRSADLVIRIPEGNLNTFVNRVEGMSNIISSNEKVDDVTLTYVAVESRVKALEAEEARLLELMAKAESMGEILEVQSRLTDVRYELESVTSRLRVMQNQVSYATVSLNVREVRTLTVVEEESVWQQMTRGFGENLRNLGDGIVEFAIFLVVSLPYLVPMGAIAAVVVILTRRSAKKKKAARAAKAAPPAQNSENAE